MIVRLLGIGAFLLLTAITQVGGAIFLLCWLASRYLYPKSPSGLRRASVHGALFVALYAVAHVVVVPQLAALAGRVPLPCSATAERPFRAGSSIFCILNRHYVDPRLVTVMTNLSREVDRLFPGTVTLYLDANFPFVDGFPLPPHLSHHDGRKIDIAYYYASPSGSYLPDAMRSPIGYWAFEQPAPTDISPCRGDPWLSMRWNMSALQPLFPDRPIETERTSAALRWLVREGAELGIERIFVEPYLARRLGVSSPVLGFQGCRAARHDDHIHFQIRR